MRRLALLTLLALPGCGDELALAQNIEDNRVLAARIEVEGDAERAWPTQGERALARFFVVDPGERAPLGWALGVCARDDSEGKIPGCSGPIFAQSISADVALAEPQLAFEVPELPTGSDLLVLGVICARGLPTLPGGLGTSWPSKLGCVGSESRATRVFAPVHVATDDASNRNPSLADDAARLDGALLDVPADPFAAPEGCAAAGTPGVPLVAAGSGEHRLVLEVSPDDREATPSGVETLSVASFSTAGELDRVFSFVEGADPTQSPSVELEWEAPGSAPQSGRLVRFHFVMRDGRGGVDFTTRSVCVVP